MRAVDGSALERAARSLVEDVAAPGAALNHVALLAHRVGATRLAADLLGAAARGEPREPAWVNNLANLLHEGGFHDEAIEAYRRALALAPDHASARFNLGKALLAVGEAEEAAKCFRAVARANPRDAGALTSLGGALLDAGDPEGAIEAHRAALVVAPDDPDALNDLGLALMDQGDFEGAATAYRRALERRPDFSKACLNLSATRRFTAADRADRERIEAVLRARGLDASARAEIHFALGKVHDDLGEYDEAFEHYREGNARLRARGMYSAEAQVAWVDRLIDTFDAAAFERGEGAGARTETPILIVGMPRSGTTLVEQILASHPRCHGAGELPFLERMSATLPARAGVPYPECVAKLDAAGTTALGREYLDAVARRTRGDPLRVTDKTPGNYYHLGLAALTLPGTRVVHCRRSPMDVCVSLYFHLFTGGHGFAWDLADIAAEYRLYRRLMAHWDRVLPLDTLTIDYEALVGDQEGESRRLVEFCGLEWDRACLEFHRTSRQVHTASNWQVRQPIYRRSVERWRRYERHLGPLIDGLKNLEPPG